MKIVILHSHLKRGGVSTVIASQIQALAGFAELELSVLSGEGADSPEKFGGTVEVEPVLGYMDPTLDYSEEEVFHLFDSITEILKSSVPEGAVLHAHNLSLGKNPVLTLAVARLAAKGMRVVNHCHDFAEDRPANLAFMRRIISGKLGEELHNTMYPDFLNYHYAVLTRADESRLKKYGVVASRSHLLANPAALPKGLENHSESKAKVFEHLSVADVTRRLVVYPVRAIKRKNIGEFILLSVLFKDTSEFVVTLPPANPLEKTLYEKWVEFVRERLCGNVHFEVGVDLPFDTVMSAADCCLTTSVREGFGMMYIEPWLFGKAVVGRDLPNVTADFKCSGIEFPALYESIAIKGDAGFVVEDFAEMDVDFQMRFVGGLLENPKRIGRFLADNPGLTKLFDPVEAIIIDRNANVVKSEYSIEKYGDRLNEAYTKLF